MIILGVQKHPTHIFIKAPMLQFFRQVSQAPEAGGMVPKESDRCGREGELGGGFIFCVVHLYLGDLTNDSYLSEGGNKAALLGSCCAVPMSCWNR